MRSRTRLWFAAASAVMLVLYLAITYYFFGPMRHAKLGLIDDHEILRFIGPDHHIGLTDIPSILFGDTEVGQWGSADRLRPVYYLFRIIESALWRDNAGLWYLTRMALVVLTALGMSFVVLRGFFSRPLSTTRSIFASVVAFVFGLLVVSFPAWGDIATRLGPSEIYVSAGVTLFVISATELWRRPDKTLFWVLMFVGYVIIVGSKEDGVIFAVPFAAIYLVKFWSSRRRIVNVVLGVVATAFSVYVTLGLLIATGKSGGADMYGNTRSTDGLLLSLNHNAYLLAVVCFFLFTVGLELIGRQQLTNAVSPTNRVHRLLGIVTRFPLTLASGVCVYVVVIEAYFYQDYYAGLPDGSRYAFLTDFATVGSFALVLVALHHLSAARRATRVVLAVTAVIVFSVSPVVDNVVSANRFRAQSLVTAAHSIAVNAQIQVGVADLSRHDGSVAVLLVDQPLEYEPVFALPQYLRYYGSTEAVYLSVTVPKSLYVGQTPLLQVLVGRMTEWAKIGHDTAGWRILPAKTRDPSRYTVCFYFGTAPTTLAQCDSSHQIG